MLKICNNTIIARIFQKHAKKPRQRVFSGPELTLSSIASIRLLNLGARSTFADQTTSFSDHRGGNLLLWARGASGLFSFGLRILAGFTR
jgi:hypothetical protein